MQHQFILQFQNKTVRVFIRVTILSRRRGCTAAAAAATDNDDGVECVCVCFWYSYKSLALTVACLYENKRAHRARISLSGCLFSARSLSLFLFPSDTHVHASSIVSISVRSVSSKKTGASQKEISHRMGKRICVTDWVTCATVPLLARAVYADTVVPHSSHSSFAYVFISLNDSYFRFLLYCIFFVRSFARTIAVVVGGGGVGVVVLVFVFASSFSCFEIVDCVHRAWKTENKM